MKTFLLFTVLLFGFTFAFAQGELSPVVEKEVKYKNFKYKDINDFKEVDLRAAISGKKLAMVVYFAPWCPNWKHQAPLTQRLYDKYKANGFVVIGVGEYDSVDMIKDSVDGFKITFPVVFESMTRAAQFKTDHYEYRKATGDTRNWGSPWNIFLVPAEIKPKGDTLTEKTFVVNGELIEADAEAFIRQKLGLPKEEKKAAVAATKSGEVCEPTPLKKPSN